MGLIAQPCCLSINKRKRKVFARWPSQHQNAAHYSRFEVFQVSRPYLDGLWYDQWHIACQYYIYNIIYRGRESVLYRGIKTPRSVNNFEVFWDRGKELFRVLYISSELKVVLIYGCSLPRYEDTIRLWFTFVFYELIINLRILYIELNRRYCYVLEIENENGRPCLYILMQIREWV